MTWTECDTACYSWVVPAHQLCLPYFQMFWLFVLISTVWISTECETHWVKKHCSCPPGIQQTSWYAWLLKQINIVDVCTNNDEYQGGACFLVPLAWELRTSELESVNVSWISPPEGLARTSNPFPPNVCSVYIMWSFPWSWDLVQSLIYPFSPM